MNLSGSLSGRSGLTGSVSAVPSMVGGLSVPGSRGGITDYELLTNKPQIESVTLIGNKTFEEIGLEELSGEDLISILTD